MSTRECLSRHTHTDAAPLDHLLRRELDHRLANVFQLTIGTLERAARHTSNHDARHSIGKAIVQLSAHAMVNRLLASPASDDAVECGAFLAELAAALQEALPPTRRITLWVEADEVSLPAARSRLLGMLVHELVLNAVKHAFGPQGGHIVIQLSQAGSQTHCSVRDNGLGIRDIDPLARGVGMTLVQLLAQQAGASCAWQVHHDGTEAIISLHADAPAHADAQSA